MSFFYGFLTGYLVCVFVVAAYELADDRKLRLSGPHNSEEGSKA